MGQTQKNKFQKLGDWMKQHPKTSIGIALVIFVLWLVNTFQPPTTSPATSDASQSVSEKRTTTPPVPQTDQQRLETTVQGQLGGAGIQVSFRDANIDKDDPVRPAGSKFVTVNLNLGDFWDKNQLISDSGTIVSNIIQEVYVINPNFYDVIVMFYGPTKDQYGNSKTDLILSYGTDRPEEQRINWAGFDKTGLCALLTSDATAQNDVYLGCHVLVNIK